MRVMSRKPLEIAEKECATCEKVLPTTEFKIKRRTYYHHSCLECERIERKQKYWAGKKPVHHARGRRRGIKKHGEM